MFRSLISSLFTARPQAKARPQVLRFRPQLEVLENRLAPSGIHFSPPNVVQVQNDVHGIHNTQFAVATEHSNVFQLQNDVSGIGNSQVAIVTGGHDHH